MNTNCDRVAVFAKAEGSPRTALNTSGVSSFFMLFIDLTFGLQQLLSSASRECRTEGVVVNHKFSITGKGWDKTAALIVLIHG